MPLLSHAATVNAYSSFTLVMYAVASQDIDLSEALCGFTRVVKTLDDRDLVITSHPGDVIKHGTSANELH